MLTMKVSFILLILLIIAAYGEAKEVVASWISSATSFAAGGIGGKSEEGGGRIDCFGRAMQPLTLLPSPFNCRCLQRTGRSSL